MTIKYQVNDPFFESFFITDKKQLQTAYDLINIFACYLHLDKSQFTIDNLPQKINSVSEDFIFKVTIINSCRDITFHFARGKEIILYNCYRMKRDEVITQFQKSGIYYSYQCANKNLQFLIASQNALNIKYPFFAVLENSKVEVNLKGKTVTLKYDQKEFTVTEEDKANEAYQVIYSSYNHFIKIENICIFKNEADRKKIEGNYHLKSGEKYTIEIYHRFNFKNLKIKGKLMNEKLSFLATVYDAKKQLAKVLSNGCDVLQPEDIIICDYMKKEIKDEKKLLRDINSFRVYINYMISKGSYHPIEKEVRSLTWSLSRTMNDEENKQKRKQLPPIAKNEIKSEDDDYLEEEETESYHVSEEIKIRKNEIKIENNREKTKHVGNHHLSPRVVHSYQESSEDTNMQIEKKSEKLIDEIKEVERNQEPCKNEIRKNEKKSQQLGDTTKQKEVDNLEENDIKNKTNNFQKSNKGRIRQNKKKSKKLKSSKVKPKEVNLKEIKAKRTDIDNDIEKNEKIDRKNDDKIVKQEDKAKPEESNSIKGIKKKTEIDYKQEPKQRINKKEKTMKGNNIKLKNKEQKQEQKNIKLEFNESKSKKDENQTNKSKSEKKIDETEKKIKTSLVNTNKKLDVNKDFCNSKEASKSNKETVKCTKSKRNLKSDVNKKQNKQENESCKNDNKLQHKPECDVKDDKFTDEAKGKKAKRKPIQINKSNDKDDKTIKITFLFEENNVKQNESFILDIFPNVTIKELKMLVSKKVKIENNISLSYKKERNYITIDDNSRIKDIFDKIGCKNKQKQITNYIYIKINEPTVSTDIDIDSIQSTNKIQKMNDDEDDEIIDSIQSTNEIKKMDDDEIIDSIQPTNEIQKMDDDDEIIDSIQPTNEIKKMDDDDDEIIDSIQSTIEIKKMDDDDDEIDSVTSTNEIEEKNDTKIDSINGIERRKEEVGNKEIKYEEKSAHEIEKKNDAKDKTESEVKSTSEINKINDDNDEITSVKSTNGIDRTNVEEQDDKRELEEKSINSIANNRDKITTEMIPIFFKFEQRETRCSSFIRPIHINTNVKMLEQMISNEFNINDDISLYYKNENSYYMDIDKNACIEDIIDQITYKEGKGKFKHCIFVQITKKPIHKKDKKKNVKQDVKKDDEIVQKILEGDEKIRIDFSFENNVKRYEPFSENINVKARIKDIEKLIRNKYEIGEQISILYKENEMFIEINRNTRIEEILNHIKKVYRNGIIRNKLYIKVLKPKQTKYDANIDNLDSIQKIKHKINIYSHLYKIMNDSYDEDED